MAPACTFALFLLIATIVSCNTDPLLIARQPSLPCLSYECPATDLALYPLAPDFSGPVISNTSGQVKYLACFYPFLSNCQYYLTTGILAADNDNNYCPPAQQNCAGSICSYACPAYDIAGYQSGAGSGAQNAAGILFCTYPTSQQLNAAVLFCRYRTSNGALTQDNDVNFCPQIASATVTPYCPSHTGLMAPTTVASAVAPATSAPVTLASPSTAKPPVVSTAPSRVTSNPFQTSPASRVVNLSSRYLGTAIVVVVMTLCLAVLW